MFLVSFLLGFFCFSLQLPCPPEVHSQQSICSLALFLVDLQASGIGVVPLNPKSTSFDLRQGLFLLPSAMHVLLGSMSISHIRNLIQLS